VVLSVVPPGLEAFAAANAGAAEMISAAGSADSPAMLDAAAAAIGPIGASTSEQLWNRPSVVFAIGRMDDDPRWCLLAPGELVHVDETLRSARNLVLPEPPKHLLRKSDLSPHAQLSQHIPA
jgi:hypothetical protein